MSNSNLLANETSPYLLQHANNPVHWQPWNEDSLKLAQQENKPILLSIGYSACHWCHVMAHESFEDQETADIMNKLFINIKVDKEERPDLDKIYQNAHSMLTERAGGWPLTLFLDPNDHMPVFAGTYFPKEARHGLPAFKQLLEHIHDAWLNRQDDIKKQSASLQEIYQRIADASRPIEQPLNNLPIDIARNQIEKQFDSQHGGFSEAPKFPHPSIIERAMRHWAQSKHDGATDPRILHSAIFSLYKMANGGIYDHLGGGFCRYSTDTKWMIPHFEKMLYDNGPLLALYAQCWCLSDDPRFYNTAIETADWVMREMQAADGGYYSALDADTDGVEGKFYVWTQEEAKSVIQQELWPLFEKRFGLDKNDNFEGKWHLHGYTDELELSKHFKLSIKDVFVQLKQAKRQLFELRQQRSHPGRDEKILSAWNGLMIYGMASTGRLLQQPQYIESATRAAVFIKENSWQSNRLLASYKDGRAQFNAYLDDYAFLLQGLLELLQASWDNNLYQWACDIADTLIEQFEDKENGGFFFTSHDHEQLIQRIKSFSDDAIPSGNAIACLSLNRLGYLSGKTRYIKAAENCLKAGWQSINQAPISHCAMINALSEFLSPPTVMIIRSTKDENHNYSYHRYLPTTMTFNIPADLTIHQDLAQKSALSHTCGYPCQGMECLPVLNSSQDIEDFLQNNSYRVSE